MVYGDTGIGKTTSLETLPEAQTVLCIGERGVLPLRNTGFPVLRFQSWDDLQQLFRALRDPSSIPEEDTKKTLAKTKIVAVDSLSSASEMCMKHIIGVDRRALMKERTDKKRDTPENVYEDLMTQEDWGLYFKRMMNFVSAFSDLSYHTILTCRAGWSRDKDGGDTIRCPGLSGKSARECGAYVDELFYMESRGLGEQETRVWRTFNDGRIMAKDSSRALDQFEPADWTAVLKKIVGTNKKETDK
jgi:hypothetical protein